MTYLKERPLVSIIIPLYNAELFIADAIDSIINQTYTNWEGIVINDSSTDNSLRIVQSFSDKRIKVVNQARKSGIVNALNAGIRAAGGKYIARMDADDICEPERIETQVKYMEANPEIILSGTRAAVIDSKGN
jgi:glycosyltransferase involved in cell wall biosynthesis